MREYRVSEIALGSTIAKAQKLAARSQKKGLSGGYTIRTETRTETVDGIKREYTVLIVEGEPIKYGGYQFVGVAEFIEGKALTKTLPDGVEVKGSTVKVGWCDHCQITRRRSKVIFVKSESGDVSQVGSSCVKDFLGWDFTPTSLPTFEDFEQFSGGAGEWGGCDTLSVMAYTVAACEVTGYIPASDFGSSTKSLVWGKCIGTTSGSEMWRKTIGSLPTPEQYTKAQEIIEFAKTMSGESAYAENLRLVAGLEFQKYNTVGIMVSAYKAWQRASDIAEEAKSKPAPIEFKKEQFAPTGTKIELEAVLTGSNSFETVYGTTTLYTFTSGDYQFKWFASGYPIDQQNGAAVKVKGTVKGVDEYNGTFSTLLTRCKLVA